MSESILNKSVSYGGYYDTGEEIYASCMQFNALLKMTKKDGEVEIVATFPNESLFQVEIHQKIYCENNTLIFIPSYGKSIHTYDLKSGRMGFYSVETIEGVRSRCIDSHRVGDRIWMFYDFVNHPIVIYDVNTHDIQYYDGWGNALPEEIKVRKTAIFWSCFAWNENELYGAIWNSCYVLHMNLDTMEVNLISLEGSGDKLIGVAYDTGVLYLTQWDSEEIKAVNLLDGTERSYHLSGETKREESCKYVYSNVIACQGQIIVVPNFGRTIYLLRHEDGMIMPYVDLPEEYQDATDYRRGWRRRFAQYLIGEGLRLCPFRANMMLDINVLERTVCEQIYRFGKVAEQEYFKRNVCGYIEEQRANGEICESQMVTLQDYLKYVTYNM